MRFPWLLLTLWVLQPAGTALARTGDAARWRATAAAVTIVRDNWGIAHVYGNTDADTVFGTLYAQAEDDFPRIERNYLSGLGRLAEADGEAAIYADLRQRLFVEPAQLEALYGTAPPWLRKLMVAWADGLNFYLASHPQTRPKVLLRFEPWMALAFTEGSIGGDVEAVDLKQLEEFYGGGANPTVAAAMPEAREASPGGSNGFAIAPSGSASGHALLWINPHTTFYFRSELQMVSNEGLNTYGAVTWGQFFVYQGFNSRNGWMHTSYGGDAIDEYAETVLEKGDQRFYAYGGTLRPIKSSRIRISYRDSGAPARRSVREFTVYHSHHGPIVRTAGGKWIAVKLFQDPVNALMQSYLRTKTRDYDSFRDIQNMRTDTSNNTVYADGDGTIAYFHGNFIPRRNTRFDFTHPVDGSNPATEWHGPHALAETIMLKNPRNGWIQNTNNWPFSAAGPDSPKRADFPPYMWIKGENPRGIHAVEVLQNLRDVSLDGLIATAYDNHLTAFEVLLPPLLRAYAALPDDAPSRRLLAEPVAALQAWDRRTAADSVATALAIFWGNAMIDLKGAQARDADEPVYDFLVEHVSDTERVAALETAVANLTRDFGTWRTPWGDVNRFQRLTDDLAQPFDDTAPSLPVGFAPAQWGALASFDSAKPRHTRRIYGSVGNSFVAAVEFGTPVRAKAIMSGGESGHPTSAHFTDQALRYTRGEFRDVLFTPSDVKAHAELTYHPGGNGVVW